MNEGEEKARIKYSLKNEDGTLQIHKDPTNHLIATALHIKKSLEDGVDPILLMGEVHETSCYWLMNDEQQHLDQEIEDDIKRTLN